MAKAGRKKTNEQEFQGQVCVWFNHEIGRRPALSLDKATTEKPRLSSGKRNDLVIWSDRGAETAFLSIELKTPTTPINDPIFFSDALEKAQHWRAPYFALWNMKQLEVYLTTAPGTPNPVPTDALLRSSLPLAITQVEEWLEPAYAAQLQAQAIDILDAAITHRVTGRATGHAIDADIFVARLTDAIGRLRQIFYRDLTKAAGTNRRLRKQLNSIATEQGFNGFVADIDYAIAGQIGYRFIGQILFYHALRRKLVDLRPIELTPDDVLPQALQRYWNDVRRYDYEALFKPEVIETLVPTAEDGQKLLRSFRPTIGLRCPMTS